MQKKEMIYINKSYANESFFFAICIFHMLKTIAIKELRKKGTSIQSFNPLEQDQSRSKIKQKRDPRRRVCCYFIPCNLFN